MNNPLISVIIPVFNGEEYIAQCLENILYQTYKNIEIVIVNDGSIDKSEAIAKNYPVKTISFAKNQGLSAARNAGIESSTGDYIHFMDVDDEINVDFYKEMVEAILENDADIACCGMINEPKPRRTMIFNKNKVLTSIDDKLKGTNVGKWGFSVRYLFRKKLINERNIRFEIGRFVEDLPFSLSAVYYSNKLVLVANAVYTYKLRELSIMTNRDKDHMKKRRLDLMHMKEIRHKLANEFNIKIPGIPTKGILALLYVKYFT